MKLIAGVACVAGLVALGGSRTVFAAAPKPAARFNNFTSTNLTNAVPGEWWSWAPRAEISPRFAVVPMRGRTGGGVLEVRTEERFDFGAWRARVTGLKGGRTYRFSAWYHAKNVPQERRSVIARLEWLDEAGRPVRPPDYALDKARRGAWTQVKYFAPVPTNTHSVEVQLGLGFVPRAAVWWDDIELVEDPAPPDRVVRAMTIFHRPRQAASPAASVEEFCRLAQGAADQKPDILCLPEGITVIGTGKSYAEVSETVPGPTTQRLGTLAKKLHSYVVAGLYERSGRVVYNTAVLVNRKGELVGSYRKTHLPREEWEQGVTPGDRYQVWDTDFGKVGLMICWDLQFPEAARALALQGADLILLPIWGGSEVLARARAIENAVFLVTSSYDMRTFIVDPAGQVLAEATRDKPVACAELRLDRPIYQPWLGDMKTRTWKERRGDLAPP